jgi:bifunctional UDP-N-acetylglucosamine pyrophosphorylase/glucosamine-1-phosphate N-acetyltransferase
MTASREEPAIPVDAAAVVLAAGQGKRMHSPLPKVLHKALGAPILRYPLDALDAAGVARKIVVTGVGRADVEKAFAGRAGVEFVPQEEQRGTAHAVLCAKEALGSFRGTLLVLAGDAPLVRAETIRGLLETHARREATATVLTGIVEDPRGYGRVVRAAGSPDAEGLVAAIVEERDATPAERAIHEINAGAYAFDAEALFRVLPRVAPTNAQGEFYLTDVVRLLVEEGGRVAARVAEDPTEALGVNRRAELAQAAAVLLERVLERHMDAGVTIVAPHLTWIEVDVEIGPDTVIEPFTTIRRGARIGTGCKVGPFAHLSDGAVLEDGAEIGNFVEVKRTRMGPKAKAKHLAYLGDGVVGAAANIGAGTIFANYDGKAKHKTLVGERAFIGSGSVLVAPVEVGPRAVTGAGAIVTRGKRVPDGETWVGVPAKPLGNRAGGGGS